MSGKDDAWNQLSVSGDPHVVLGRRQGRRIVAYRLDVHSDLHQTMRDVCRGSLHKISKTKSRPFDSNAVLEKGEEHFELTVEEVIQLNSNLETLTGQSDDVGVDEPESVDDARGSNDPQLAQCLVSPARLPLVDRSRFDEIQPFFYALCFQQQDNSWLSFIRKTNPQQFFKLGRIWCQYSDTLKRVSQEPTFALESSIDAILHERKIVGFAETPLKLLFTDFKLSRSAVPDHVRKLQKSLADSNLPLTGSAVEALISAGAKRNSVASRIYGLAARLAELREYGPLSVDRFRTIAGDDEEAMRLLTDTGEVGFDEDRAVTFLDFIEGRFFEDDWTGVQMRADRQSKRQS